MLHLLCHLPIHLLSLWFSVVDSWKSDVCCFLNEKHFFLAAPETCKSGKSVGQSAGDKRVIWSDVMGCQPLNNKQTTTIRLLPPTANRVASSSWWARTLFGHLTSIMLTEQGTSLFTATFTSLMSNNMIPLGESWKDKENEVESSMYLFWWLYWARKSCGEHPWYKWSKYQMWKTISFSEIENILASIIKKHDVKLESYFQLLPWSINISASSSVRTLAQNVHQECDETTIQSSSFKSYPVFVLPLQYNERGVLLRWVLQRECQLHLWYLNAAATCAIHPKRLLYFSLWWAFLNLSRFDLLTPELS